MHEPEPEKEVFIDSPEAEKNSGILKEMQKVTPDEEKKLVTESNEFKISGNDLFKKGEYDAAIQFYDRALELCPNCLEYEVAVLHSNMAACYLRLGAWKAAVDTATKSLGCLQRLERFSRSNAFAERAMLHSIEPPEARKVDINDFGPQELEMSYQSGKSADDIRRIQVKSLMRRANANRHIGNWVDLKSAQDDYKELLSMESLQMNKGEIESALKLTSMDIERVRQREIDEMMGKLKDFGNSLLKPFGLSTDNFQFTKDKSSDGYSLRFDESNNGE